MANDTTATKPAVKKAAPRKAAAKAATGPAKKATPRKTAATSPPPAPPPGWYLDHGDAALSRYWDGQAWLGDPIPTAMVDAADKPSTTLDDAATYDVDADTITFRRRTMAVLQPEPEQLVVWQLTLKRLEGMDRETTTNEQAAHLVGRALRVIQSVLAADTDKDWVEDQILEHKMGLTGAFPIIHTTLALFAQKRRREGKTPAPAAKATAARRRR